MIVGLMLWSGCPYSFTGASLPSEYKTISIPMIDDVSGAGEFGLREKLTEKLISKFNNDNTLKIEDKRIADTGLDAAIITVRDEPSTISGNEKVNTRRITLGVKVTFNDLKNRKKIWEKNFSNWGEYEASGLSNRQKGFDSAIDKLTEDILIGTVSDW